MLLTMPVVELFFDLSGTGSTGTTAEAIVTETGEAIVTETGEAIVVDASAVGSGTGFYTIEDPIFGVIGGPGVLAGDLATDVSRYVLDVSITRGKSRQLDETQTGTAQITFRNDDRRFDPLNTSSPYAGNIIPGKKVQVTLSGQFIYAGTIDDWNFGYDLNGVSIATITCIDAIGTIAKVDMTAWTPVAGQTSGARVTAVLDRAEVSFPSSRSIGTGSATLQAAPVDDGTNVLQYLQLVTDSEQGHLYASKSNVLTFAPRNTNANQTATVFADSSAGIRYNAIEVSYGTEYLFNTTIVSRVGGSTETFVDTDSVALYGRRTLSKTELLYDTDQQSSDLGAFLVAQYADPELRIATIGVTVARLTSTQQTALFGLELGDVVSVTFVPDGLGSAITREGVIEGIQHDVRRDDWSVSLSLGDTTSRFVFTVGDATYGAVEGPGLVAF